jgi:E3 ubiquitin-protein ligase MYCBP2
MNCPLCKQRMKHPSLADLSEPLEQLEREVKQRAMQRLRYENKENVPEIAMEGSPYYRDPEAFAMHHYAYYQCFKCRKPYYGGLYECAAAGGNAEFDPSELLCGACSPVMSQSCAKHGKEFIEFKCRFCCSIAVWFCFGTTHFCEPCHNNHSRLCSTKKEELLKCPCKPKGRSGMPEKLDGPCPLGVDHPPHGEEFALGCGVCRNVQSF